MKEAQLSAAGIVKNVLDGNNLNKAFQNYLKDNQIKPKDLSQIKDLVFGTLRSYGKTKFVINKLVKRPPSNRLISTLLNVALFQLISNRSNSYTVVVKCEHPRPAAPRESRARATVVSPLDPFDDAGRRPDAWNPNRGPARRLRQGVDSSGVGPACAQGKCQLSLYVAFAGTDKFSRPLNSGRKVTSRQSSPYRAAFPPSSQDPLAGSVRPVAAPVTSDSELCATAAAAWSKTPPLLVHANWAVGENQKRAKLLAAGLWGCWDKDLRTCEPHVLS